MKSLKNTTAAELQGILGLEGPPVIKTLLVTALGLLSPAAKQDIIQFLTPAQSRCKSGHHLPCECCAFTPRVTPRHQ